MRRVNAVGFEHIYVISSKWWPVTVYRYADKGDLSCIGIVKVKDTITDTVKYYIGVGKGENLEFDEDLIATSGAPFFLRMLEGI